MGVRRVSSKVLIVDEHRHVLLFSGIDRTKPHLLPRWFPAGGAAEIGESPEEAAIREVLEETGLIIDDPGPILFTRRFSWDFEGSEYDQEESFFLVRTSRFEPTSIGWTDTEFATFRGHRWWSIEQLRATDETVFPDGLAAELERLLAE